MDTLLGIDLQPALLGLGPDVLPVAILFLVTASLVAFCVPGVIVPMAVTSSLLVGMWQSVAIVGLGALVGSQVLFTVVRHLARDRMHARFGTRLQRFELRFAAYGIWYVIGLRLVGAPHFVVTTGSALLPIGPWAFAGATLLGVLPSIAVAAAAGTAL